MQGTLEKLVPAELSITDATNQFLLASAIRTGHAIAKPIIRMAYIVVASIVMAYIVMAYRVMVL